MKFMMGEAVTVDGCEFGTIIGRSETLASEPTYLVRYRPSYERHSIEKWWAESAIEKRRKRA